MPVPSGLTAARTGSFSASLILFAVSCQPQRVPDAVSPVAVCSAALASEAPPDISYKNFYLRSRIQRQHFLQRFMLQVFFLPQNEKQLTANSFGISFCALFQCQNLIQHMLCRLCPNFQECQNTAFSAYQLFQTAKRSICSL